FHDGDVRGSAHPHGWAPEARTARDVHLRVPALVEAGHRALLHLHGHFEGRQLTTVRVSGQQQVHVVVDGLGEVHGLVGEQHHGSCRVTTGEGLFDVSRVLPLVPGGVVDAREVEHAAVVVDLHPFVAQGADPQGGQVLDPLSVPGVVLVVTGDVVGAVDAAQFCERGGRVGQIGDVAVHQVTRDGHGVHPFGV